MSCLCALCLYVCRSVQSFSATQLSELANLRAGVSAYALRQNSFCRPLKTNETSKLNLGPECQPTRCFRTVFVDHLKRNKLLTKPRAGLSAYGSIQYSFCRPLLRVSPAEAISNAHKCRQTHDTPHDNTERHTRRV